MLRRIDSDVGSKTRGGREIYELLSRGAGSVPGCATSPSEPHLRGLLLGSHR